jgi:hypothetical protein
LPDPYRSPQHCLNKNILTVKLGTACGLVPNLAGTSLFAILGHVTHSTAGIANDAEKKFSW